MKANYEINCKKVRKPYSGAWGNPNIHAISRKFD